MLAVCDCNVFENDLLSKLDQAETVPHTNVMQSTRVENGLKTLRRGGPGVGETVEKRKGVDIVHWMTTTIGTINSMNDSDAVIEQ